MSTAGNLAALGVAVVVVPAFVVIATPRELCACAHPGSMVVGGAHVSAEAARDRVRKLVPNGTPKVDLAEALWEHGNPGKYFARYCTETYGGDVTCRFVFERQAWLQGERGYMLHFVFAGGDKVSAVKVDQFGG